ncbi:MAG TPA: TetR/AcrR family transcriptional regulator, partial [Micromonosporaceae bacterium]
MTTSPRGSRPDRAGRLDERSGDAIGRGEHAGGTARRGRQGEAELNDQRLLAAARDVFAVSGYDASVAAVAAAAGIGMGSLYRRYASKDDLLADVCLRSMQQMSALAQSASAAGDDAVGRLEWFVRSCVDARCGAFAGVAGLIPVSEA